MQRPHVPMLTISSVSINSTGSNVILRTIPNRRILQFCKECAALRKEQNRKHQEEERLKQQVAVGQIPATADRGGTKRATLSLSRYALTALDVLAVGSSTSEVAERVIMAYLEGQDADVIAFVGRMFGPAAAN
jgi:hypothetical protein